MITSNLEFREWSEAFPNRLLGAATLDRLRHNAYRLILEGQSYRAPKPLPDEAHTGLETSSKPPTKGKVVKS
jgi:DNA replication protein DnaC